ncbi:hypothetical protein K438DRAFT_1480678, partial [Mycena galopus ATCC 62051]
ILFNSLAKRGTLAMWSLLIHLLLSRHHAVKFTASNMENFAFARDGGPPFSSILYRRNPYSGTPVNRVWFSATITVLLGLLAFARPTVSGAVFTTSVVAQYMTNSIPITGRFLGQNGFKPGPFYLGKFSPLVAAITVAWMSFMYIVLLFPAVPQIMAAGMGYTVVVMRGLICCSIAYYYFPGYGDKTRFKGPIRNI